MQQKSEETPRRNAAGRSDRVSKIRSAVFAEKMASFAAQLDREEQSMLKEILERGGMAAKDLAGVKPGVLGSASVVATAKTLDAPFFHGLLDW
jgi:hypothetical protein